MGFFAGLRNLNLTYILAALFFTLAVGIAEELYFRGIIIQILKEKGVKKAILISSVIFGVTHIGNVLGGASLPLTIIQIIYAFTFGIVFAEILILTKSIYPVILWHFVHDFFGYIQVSSAELDTQMLLLLAGISTAMLVGYAVLMWKKIR